MTVNQQHRDYLAEARAIVAGETLILPERLHLIALELAHSQEIITLCRGVRAEIEEVQRLL